MERRSTFCSSELECNIPATGLFFLLSSTRASALDAFEQHGRTVRIKFWLIVFLHCVMLLVSAGIGDGGSKDEQCKITLLMSPAVCESCSSKKTTSSALARQRLPVDSASEGEVLLQVSFSNDL
jgi:hypothetical protein